MAIRVPGKRFGERLEHSKVFGHDAVVGKKNVIADLNVTPLVDMFVILVLFLIANFSATGEILAMSKEVALPEAAHTDELQLAPVILVSKDAILLNGAFIGRTEDLTKEDYNNIPLLEEKLRDLKKLTDDLHAAAQRADELKGDVNIQADKQIEFRAMKKVMQSCTMAGYGNIAFATLSEGSGTPPAETASR